MQPDDVAPALLDLEFDAGTLSAAQLDGVRFEGRFPEPEIVPGVFGTAWRSDGYSSAVLAPIRFRKSQNFTVEFWTALESYPSALEAPLDQMTPASFANQADAGSGFDVFIDTFGRWGSRVSTSHGAKVVKAATPFPLYRWVHVAVTFDSAEGTLRQYVDGKLVGQTNAGKGAAFVPTQADFVVGRSWRKAMLGIFPINGLNAAFDRIRVFGTALSAERIEADAKVGGNLSLALASLVVPVSRFASDKQRPVYHAMPPANWTNEPHGLIRRGSIWHMFYQRTPNGPYKTQMHWGHMASTDFVHWANLPDALWPTLQTDDFGFDMKGIWSGDVVTAPDGRAVAFYTSVNHSPTFYNPGISMAVSDDPGLVAWHKLGPVLDSTGLRDFRDPYVWQEQGEWRMIVGAAVRPSGGGLAYYRCSNLLKAGCWKKQPPIAPFERMDIGSDIWEMPVMERLSGDRFILVANPIGGAISKYGEHSTRAVYWIGRWDGKTFVPDAMRPNYLDLVPGHLSPTVERDAAGNLVGIGIVDERRSDEAQLNAGWAHTFSLPRVWRLMPDGKTLGQSPLPALASLRKASGAVTREIELAAHADVAGGDFGRAAEFIVAIDPARPDGRYGVYLAASPDGAEVTRILFDGATNEVVLDRTRSSAGKDTQGPSLLRGTYDVAVFGRPRTFHVFIDHSVVDVFINDAAAFSFRIYPERSDSTGFGVFADAGGRSRIEAWQLDPAHRP